MRGVLLQAGAVIAAAVVAAGCGGSAPSCTPQQGGATAFPTVDAWCQVSMVNGDIVPNAGVTPYNLNTPLFSDYAVKRRTVWMPPGASASYDATGVFQFPEGTVLTKSFGIPDDVRKAQPTVRWVETRVMWLTGGEWNAISYTWDDAQKTTTPAPGGGIHPMTFIGPDGQSLTANYLVPSIQQCRQCHEDNQIMIPIGPKARNLNRDLNYPDGTTENQLVRWTRLGLLSGAPDPSAAPKLPVWNDPSTGTLDERARAYLEGNCAHCHSRGGEARNTALFLSTLETDPIAYGICKKPVAAGGGAGGNLYDIVPGQPDESIIPHRLDSIEPSVAMPQIGRSVVDEVGLQLIRDWITSLPGSCP
jgi:uncharacterized repeat protein (TIGR03806 family)